MTLRAILVGACALLIGSTAGAAEPAETLFQQRCGGCHALAPAKGKMGPPLAGVVGKRMGSATGYEYSAGMKRAARVWTTAELDGFLAAPAKWVPGTKMMVGVADPAQRRAIVDYLSTRR